MKAVLLLVIALAIPTGALFLLFSWCQLDWRWYVDGDSRGIATILWVLSLFVVIPGWASVLDE